jgi:hypothetical protein
VANLKANQGAESWLVEMKCDGSCFIRQILSNLLLSITTLPQFYHLLFYSTRTICESLASQSRRPFLACAFIIHLSKRLCSSLLHPAIIFPSIPCGKSSLLDAVAFFFLFPSPVLVSRYLFSASSDTLSGLVLFSCLTRCALFYSPTILPY